MRVTKWLAPLILGITLGWPAAAQEEPAPKEPPPPEPPTQAEEKAPPPVVPAKKTGIEEPALHRWGGWTIALSAWQPTLVGADEELATVSQNGTPVPLLQGSNAAIEETVDVCYHLPSDVGGIAAHYDSIGEDDVAQYFTPGQFLFLESRAFPITLGVFDDGASDGLVAHTGRKTREFRLEFRKQAFDTKWARGTWGAGYRSLSHSRTFGITYYAIVPNFPPAIPPANSDPNVFFRLQPLPDQVGQTSNFSGSGLGASFDVEFPVHPRVSILSGISIGLLRGKSDGSYSSLSSYYAFNYAPNVPLTKDFLFELIANPPPVDPNADPPTPAIADVNQFTVSTRLSTLSTPEFAQSYDLYIGLEVSVWKGLKVFGTLRDVYYANVGTYVAPTIGVANERTPLNAGYEGYTLGLSWRF